MKNTNEIALCPHCEGINPKDALFCTICKKGIKPTQPEKITEKISVANCPYCYKEIDSRATICPYCRKKTRKDVSYHVGTLIMAGSLLGIGLGILVGSLTFIALCAIGFFVGYLIRK